jgi:hypothetical protein
MKNELVIKLVNSFYSLAMSKDMKNVLKEIEKADTYKEKIKLAEKNFKHVSSGSSRIVYKTKDNTIIKLAKNDKGIAQNKAESNPEMKSKYLNKILKHADNYSWLETCYLDKIIEQDFEDMTKVNFKDFGAAIKYGLKEVSGNSSKSKPKNFDKVEKSDIYKEMLRIGKKFNLMPGDLSRISSWGTKDNKPILIDAGLTKKIFEKFYE